MNKVIYGVFSGYYDCTGEGADLDSLWSTEEAALKEVEYQKKVDIKDYVYIAKLNLDSQDLYNNE